MKLLRPFLFIHLLAILLSLSISLTTNSDHTSTAVLEWKGGDGAKRSRVRRQNLDLPVALRLPEKAYALYVLWRLLNEASNNTNTIRTSTMRPDKLESMTSEGPKIKEIIIKPSLAPTQEPSTQSTGITGPYDSTAMASLNTDPSSPYSQKTQSGDPRPVKQSTQQLQTTIQKILEPSQVTEQNMPDSTTFKIPSKNIEEPSSDIMNEESTPSTGTNDSTAITSFPTELPTEESQKKTQSGAPQLFTQQSTQHLQHSEQEITEPSQVTEQHIPDSTTLTIKTSFKAEEEPFSTIIQKQIDNLTGITDTKDSTAMAYFPTNSPDPQKTTQSGDSLLVKQLTMAKQKITESSQVTEQHMPDSTTFKIPSKNIEEPSSDIMNEESTPSTGTNDSTAIMSFPTELPTEESQKKTQSGAPQLFTQQSTQHLQHSEQEITEPSQVTEQHIPDSTTLTIKTSFKAEEEPFSTIIQKQIDNLTGITDTKDSTAMAYFPTNSPDPQKTTQSGDSLLVKQLTMAKQKITESSQVTEQHMPNSTIFKIPSKTVEEPSLDIMNEENTRSAGINDSTAITSFPTELPTQESQKNIQSGAPKLITQQSTQHLQRSKEEITEPSQVTEQHIPDSTTLTIKISFKAEEEPSTTIIHKRIANFTGITYTKDSTAMEYFPSDSPDSQKTTQSGDSLLVNQLTMAKQKITEPSQVTEQHMPDTTTFKIPSKTVEEPSSDIMNEENTRSTGINDSTPITSFPTELPTEESQKKTQSGAPQLFTQQSTQHLQHSEQEITEPSQVTEQHIPDSTTLTIKTSFKAEEEPFSTIIQKQIDNLTGITDTKDSTAMAYFPTNSPDPQKTTQSGDSLLVKQLTMAKQKITESSQVTEQHMPNSTTFKIPSKTVEEPSLDIMNEENTRSAGINDSTAITSFPTELPTQESQKNIQSGAPKLFTQQSTQHLQRSKEEITEPSQVTEQHIPDSTTLTIKIFSRGKEEPSSTIIHDQIDHFTGITDTKDSTAMEYFPSDSQKTTQSGDSLLVKQLTMAKQKITEPSQVTEQHMPDSTTFKIPSKTVEEPSSDIMNEENTRSTGINDSTPITSFPTELPIQESQKNTQSGAPQQSTQHLQHSKQEIPEPSQITEQHIPDSTTLTIKIFSRGKEEPSSTIIHERIDHFTGIADTKDSTAMEYLPTHSQKTQSGDFQLVEQSKQKITEPSHVTEQHMPHSKTITIEIPSKAVEEPSSTTIHDQIAHEHPRRGITGMVKSISKPTLPARTKNPTLSSSAVKLEILETSPYTHSVTGHNGKPNQFVTATDQRFPKPTPPAFTLKQQIQDSTSLLLTEESHISHLDGFTSDPEGHKPTPTEEPTNQYTEQNANTAKSSRDSIMQHFMTTKTHQTNDSPVSSKTASTSPLLSLTVARLVNSKEPGDTSVPMGISLQASRSSAAPFRTSQMNPKTQSQSTTYKYPIHGTIIPHTSVLLVKDTSSQAPTDKVRSSQTISVSTEKLTVTFTPNPKPSDKDTHTTSVVRHGFLTLRTQEIPFWISTKLSNLYPIETTEPQSDLKNQDPTADTVAKENYINEKPTQSTTGRKRSKTTRTAITKLPKTQKVSQNFKKLHTSTDTAIKDDTQTGRGTFGSLFSLGCLILLMIIILLWVVWRTWQARHWRNNIWVAGPPLLSGTYHSVLQSSSPHTAIEMMKGNTQKNRQENHDVEESIALRQQQQNIH